MRIPPLAAALLALLVVAAPASAAGRRGAHPWCDTALSPDERAGLLLAELTLDEKISLMAGDDPSTGFNAAARLPQGRYVATVRATDSGGSVERKVGGFNRRSFAIR